jgi:hypothetical protein
MKFPTVAPIAVCVTACARAPAPRSPPATPPPSIKLRHRKARFGQRGVDGGEHIVSVDGFAENGQRARAPGKRFHRAARKARDENRGWNAPEAAEHFQDTNAAQLRHAKVEDEHIRARAVAVSRGGKELECLRAVTRLEDLVSAAREEQRKSVPHISIVVGDQNDGLALLSFHFAPCDGAQPRPRRRTIRTGLAYSSSMNDERPHHVVLLVLENVTVPDVLMASRSWAHGIAHRRGQ